MKLKYLLFCLFFAGILAGKIVKADYITMYLIPLFVALLCVYSFRTRTDTGPRGLLMPAALFFAFAGDAFVNLTPWPTAAGVAFVCTHISLITFYVFIPPSARAVVIFTKREV